MLLVTNENMGLCLYMLNTHYCILNLTWAIDTNLFTSSICQRRNVWWCTSAQGLKHFINPVWQGFYCKGTNSNCSIAYRLYKKVCINYYVKIVAWYLQNFTLHVKISWNQLCITINKQNFYLGWQIANICRIYILRNIQWW